MLRLKQKTRTLYYQTWFSKPLSDSRRAITSSGIWGFSKAPYGEHSSDQWSTRWKFLVVYETSNILVPSMDTSVVYLRSTMDFPAKMFRAHYEIHLFPANIFRASHRVYLFFLKNALCKIRSHGTKWHTPGRKLHSGSSKSKEAQRELVRVLLFWKNYCVERILSNLQSFAKVPKSGTLSQY